MRIVVTGGAGFIGANLCRNLAVERGHDVLALDNLSTGHRANLFGLDGVELAVGDILDLATLKAAVQDAEVLVHLAARPSVARSLTDPAETHDVNVTGTVQVLEAARAAGVGQVVLASSSSVYGVGGALPRCEDAMLRPLSPYAASKVAAEAYVRAWHHTFGVPVLVVRLFNVFGPLQDAGHAYAAVVPAFVDAALKGRPLPVHGAGTQTRDFTFVGSVAAVLADAVDRRVTHPEPVNLAFGSRVSVLELIDHLQAVLGKVLARDHLPSRPGDVPDSQACGHLLNSLFPGLRPPGLRDGLEQTVAWFRDSGRA
jgi:UDP-glucose 4-epimerase